VTDGAGCNAVVLDHNYRVLTVVYNARDYWVFGLGASSVVLKDIKKQNVSENGPLPVR
jgi:hypothetical protein